MLITYLVLCLREILHSSIYLNICSRFFCDRSKTAVATSVISCILCTKIANKLQPTFHFKDHSSFCRLKMASAISLSTSLVLNRTMCSLPLCFSLSVKNQAHKKQFSLKSNPPVDDLINCFAESAFVLTSLFSGLIYFLLHSVCTRVSTITCKE